MKAVISTTFDDKYLYFLPIITYCWQKLNVDVICFIPTTKDKKNEEKIHLICRELPQFFNFKWLFFDAPEHKEATYAQCARLYAASEKSNTGKGDIGRVVNLTDENEILITSDIDMLVFGDYLTQNSLFHVDIFGYDLTPNTQYPMCYVKASVKTWREFMGINGKTYQQCLDDLVGVIECQDFRGNQWSLDQFTLKNKLDKYIPAKCFHPRAKEGTQFATKRYDRDDAFLLDRLSPDTIDFHMPRPGYEPQNFDIILKVLQYHYPNDNFDWLINYTNEYKKLLQLEKVY